jgi:predicted nucleic acid-binding protein
VFVVDTSVATAWCFEDEATKITEAALDRLLDEQALVPAIWPLEVANVLLVAERRGRLSEAQATRFAQLVGQLPIDVDDAATDVPSIIAAGRQHGLSAYDASYLVLAERHGIPLATLDRDLARAARKAGVPLLVRP